MASARPAGQAGLCRRACTQAARCQRRGGQLTSRRQDIGVLGRQQNGVSEAAAMFQARWIASASLQAERTVSVGSWPVCKPATSRRRARRQAEWCQRDGGRLASRRQRVGELRSRQDGVSEAAAVVLQVRLHCVGELASRLHGVSEVASLPTSGNTSASLEASRIVSARRPCCKPGGLHRRAYKQAAQCQ